MSYPGAAPKGASVSRSDAPGGANRRFPRASRLTARKSFLAIYERGHRLSTPYFVLFALPGASPQSRLGITATKRFGGAVVRNRIKRIVRELFRHHRNEGAPIDLVVNVRPTAAEASFARLEADFSRHLVRLRAKVRP